MASSHSFGTDVLPHPSAVRPGSRPHPNPAVLPGQSLRSEDGQGGQLRHRPRASRACERCRDRKTKCDQQSPCSHCAYYDLTCTYRPAGKVRRRRRQIKENGGSTIDSVARPSSGPIRPRNGEQGSLQSEDANSSRHANGPPNPSAQNTLEPTIPAPSQLQQERATAWESEEGVETLAHEGPASSIETPRLGGINTHTSGTEFYGGSSNLSFLARLFAKARKRVGMFSYAAPARSSSGARNGKAISQDPNSEPQHLNDNKLSIVNLMYSTDYHSPIDDRATAETESGTASQTRNAASCPPVSPPRTAPNGNDYRSNKAGHSTLSSPREEDSPSLRIREQSNDFGTRQVEKIFIQAYFTNLHFIHPLLSESAFRARCAEEVWSSNVSGQSKSSLQGRPSHFLALYYAVIALGAINSSINETSPLATYYRCVWKQNSVASRKLSTLEWASFYFGLAKKALGDILEISSLESCQALFIMTVFCQNALKPHACYMYSGMAVRTAIAIGLANDSPGDYMIRKEEARRTWWCIYSHEIEMCCSSGRLDSLKPPRQYSTSMPTWNMAPEINVDEKEGPDIAMISVMAELAQILKTASQDIYYDSEQRSISDKSQISFQLHDMLDTWRANLPSFLNLDTNSLNDSEWAFKQKLVLKMRFYNARIIIHRPFLVESSTSHHSSEFSGHVEVCLDAARKTINLIHDAFVNRIYLRTWWYCTTYTLYASMITLYLVLMEFPKVPGEELIADVEKSLEIFSAMDSVAVARRCAELTKEMVVVAKRYLQDCRQRQMAADSAMEMDQTIAPDLSLTAPDEQNMRTHSSVNEAWNDNFLTGLLNQEMPGLERASALANLYDPNVLEGFALSDNSSAEMASFADPSMDFSGRPGDGGEQTGPAWGVFEYYGEEASAIHFMGA